MRIRTGSAGYGLSVCLCVCVWPVSSDSFVCNYSIPSLLFPKFPWDSTLFHGPLPPHLYSYSLVENALRFNVSGPSHTKKTQHSASIYPPLTLAFIFLGLYVMQPLHSLPRLCPFPILSPFHSILQIHRYTFCHLPSKLFLFPSCPLPHPSFHCFSLRQTSSDSQTKTFTPLNPTHSLATVIHISK